MRIRPAAPEDTADVFRMTSALSLDTPPDRSAFQEQWRAVIGDERSACFVAVVATTTVGYALGFVAPMPIYGGGLALLQELYVDEAHRRAGLGRQLVDAFSVWSSEKGAAKVAVARSRAGSFYEALGFTTRPTAYYSRAVRNLRISERAL